jgi:GNAT superfamily N-acetyltransferase
MAGALNIRPVIASDRAQWDHLWRGYLNFYQQQLAPDITDTTWRRFLSPAEPLHAVVAETDRQLIGLAHYLIHRSTWATVGYCYLEDLFVDPDMRGHGVGAALIEAVAHAAEEAGAARLYWLTHETNAQAQTLYDKVASRSGFIQYRRALGDPRS